MKNFNKMIYKLNLADIFRTLNPEYTFLLYAEEYSFLL